MTKRNRSYCWNEQEDQKLAQIVEQYHEKHPQKCAQKWVMISEELHKMLQRPKKKKTGKQCRQRWKNCLDPEINKNLWTEQEVSLLFQLHKEYQNKWSQIAKHIEGRTQNSVKNTFNSTIRRCLRRMSKISGNKNSTVKMRSIKPLILSKIFSQFKIQQFNCQKTQTGDLKRQINVLCKQIFPYVIKFIHFKPTRKNSNSPQIDINLQENLQKISKINHLYEILKKKERIIKKRNRISYQSEDDDEEEQEQEQENQDNDDESVNNDVSSKQYYDKRNIRKVNNQPCKKTPLEQKAQEKVKQKNNEIMEFTQQNVQKDKQMFILMQMMVSQSYKIPSGNMNNSESYITSQFKNVAFETPKGRSYFPQIYGEFSDQENYDGLLDSIQKDIQSRTNLISKSSSYLNEDKFPPL